MSNPKVSVYLDVAEALREAMISCSNDEQQLGVKRVFAALLPKLPSTVDPLDFEDFSINLR